MKKGKSLKSFIDLLIMLRVDNSKIIYVVTLNKDKYIKDFKTVTGFDLNLDYISENVYKSSLK